MMNRVTGLPNFKRKLYIRVFPLTMVSLLIDMIRKNVKKHERRRAQDRFNPYLAPETTMEVTLPVPTTYPIMKNAGPRLKSRRLNLRNALSGFVFIF
jgi:hypothetical protein